MRKKKPRLLLKVVVLVFALYTAVSLLSLQAQINDKRDGDAVLSEELSRRRMINAALEEDIASEGDAGVMARIAREKLGLVAPGEVIFVALK